MSGSLISPMTSLLFYRCSLIEPEVEVGGSVEVMLAPLMISRNENERVLIEVSARGAQTDEAIIPTRR